IEAITDFARADLAALYTAVDPESGAFELAATFGIDPMAVPPRLEGEGSAGRAVAEERTIVVPGAEAYPRLDGAAHDLHVPLASPAGTHGVLTLARCADTPFTPTEIESIEHLATQAGLALAHALSFADA